MSTFPLRKCEIHEEHEVGIIVARELPVARIIASCGAIDKTFQKTKYKTGTNIIPPPTPSSPAKKPAQMPVVARIKTISQYVEKNEVTMSKQLFIKLKSIIPQYLNIISSILKLYYIL